MSGACGDARGRRVRGHVFMYVGSCLGAGSGSSRLASQARSPSLDSLPAAAQRLPLQQRLPEAFCPCAIHAFIYVLVDLIVLLSDVYFYLELRA